MKKYKIAALVAMFGLCFMAVPAYAQGTEDPAPTAPTGIWGDCNASVSSGICGDTTEGTVFVKRLINIALSLIGVISVVMIIHSGFKYVISRGDAEQIKSAKNTLLYAVIGLIVAILSFGIVNFVIGSFGGTGTNGTEQTNSTGGETGNDDIGGGVQ